MSSALNADMKMGDVIRNICYATRNTLPLISQVIISFN